VKIAKEWVRVCCREGNAVSQAKNDCEVFVGKSTWGPRRMVLTSKSRPGAYSVIHLKLETDFESGNEVTTVQQPIHLDAPFALFSTHMRASKQPSLLPSHHLLGLAPLTNKSNETTSRSPRETEKSRAAITTLRSHGSDNELSRPTLSCNRPNATAMWGSCPGS